MELVLEHILVISEVYGTSWIVVAKMMQDWKEWNWLLVIAGFVENCEYDWCFEIDWDQLHWIMIVDQGKADVRQVDVG